MPDTFIYWDANPFLSYINEHPDRMPTLDILLDGSADGNNTICTSAISQVEVAFAASEQQQRALDPQEEQKIDSLWSDPEAVALVEYHGGIGRQARTLMRDAIARGWSLKPLDAVHLATAMWLAQVGFQVDEFHTYDGALEKYAVIVGFTICEPHTAQPRML